jgi:Flp pilus assembly protein CpaB
LAGDAGEIQKLRKEMEIEIEKQERQKEGLAHKMGQMEKDLQLALKQEQQAHDEDNERLKREKVGNSW